MARFFLRHDVVTTAVIIWHDRIPNSGYFIAFALHDIYPHGNIELANDVNVTLSIELDLFSVVHEIESRRLCLLLFTSVITLSLASQTWIDSSLLTVVSIETGSSSAMPRDRGRRYAGDVTMQPDAVSFLYRDVIA